MSDKPDRDVNRIDPALWEPRSIREALATRDIPAMYRMLYQGGVSQQEIARLTGQQQLDSAHSLIMLGRPDQARSSLAAARDGWDPADRFDQADMDHVMAQAHRGLGLRDSAEQLAAVSVRTWGEQHRRDGAQAAITLASIHVEAGEPDGLRLAENVIREVESLRSGRARAQLGGLADVLATRPGGSPRELAVHARRVAAGRA